MVAEAESEGLPLGLGPEVAERRVVPVSLGPLRLCEEDPESVREPLGEPVPVRVPEPVRELVERAVPDGVRVHRVLPEGEPVTVPATTESESVLEKDRVLEKVGLVLADQLAEPVVVAVPVTKTVGVFPSFRVASAVQDLADERLLVPLELADTDLVSDEEPVQVATAEPVLQPLPVVEDVLEPAGLRLPLRLPDADPVADRLRSDVAVSLEEGEIAYFAFRARAGEPRGVAVVVGDDVVTTELVEQAVAVGVPVRDLQSVPVPVSRAELVWVADWVRVIEALGEVEPGALKDLEIRGDLELVPDAVCVPQEDPDFVREGEAVSDRVPGGLREDEEEAVDVFV